MLTITQPAATLLAHRRSELGAPESYGIKLFAPDAEEGGASDLAIAFVPDAEPGDTVTEQAGLRAFVAPDLAARLKEATLDATPTNGTPPELILR